jgi:hypothetical protein
MATTVLARIPFTYVNQPLERGELVVLKGSPKDDQLRGLGYFLLYEADKHNKISCLDCGRVFATSGFLEMHRSKKGGCLGPSAPITNIESAILMGVDENRVRVEA